MSKKQVQEVSAETSTVSTRFTSKQRKVIEQAAELLKCSTAQLLRDAALHRAADVINASGSRTQPLRKLAEKVLVPIICPAVEIRGCPRDEPESGEEIIELMTVEDWQSPEIQWFEEERMREIHNEYMNVRHVAVKPDAHEVEQLRKALKSCPVQFTQMLLELWDTVTMGNQTYYPAVSVDDLLKEDDSK